MRYLKAERQGVLGELEKQSREICLFQTLFTSVSGTCYKTSNEIGLSERSRRVAREFNKEHLINCEVGGKTNKMQQLDVYYQHFLNMFRASLCPSSGEQDVCYCTCCGRY